MQRVVQVLVIVSKQPFFPGLQIKVPFLLFKNLATVRTDTLLSEMFASFISRLAVKLPSVRLNLCRALIRSLSSLDDNFLGLPLRSFVGDVCVSSRMP